MAEMPMVRIKLEPEMVMAIIEQRDFYKAAFTALSNVSGSDAASYATQVLNEAKERWDNGNV